MREALLYEQLENGEVQCAVCARLCTIESGKTGFCGVRANIDGTLYSLVYGKAATVNIDPIEKKPLFHFQPGSDSLSIGTVGCNFKCPFCQNWEISQHRATVHSSSNDHSLTSFELDYRGMEISPQALVDHCVKRKLPGISYTYNEPTVFLEYAFDTSRLAKQKGLKNVFVSNGYESRQTMQLLSPYLDGINIDLKAYTEEFYREQCRASLHPVLDTIRLAHDLGIWVEVTTLLIPGINDDEAEITALAEFITGIADYIPWHITAFHPDYQVNNIPRTSMDELLKAYALGKQAGLKYVYLGNVLDEKHSTTWCPGCGAALITRSWHSVRINNLQNGQCQSCHQQIEGVWQ